MSGAERFGEAAGAERLSCSERPFPKDGGVF